jgi:hypothetical protein
MVRRWLGQLAAVAVVVLLAAPAAAQADGPCGQDDTGNSACQLAFPSTSSGTLQTSNENDYYVFKAQAGQELFITVTDTESPSCSGCGYVDAGLYDASGNQVYGASTGASEPNNGITIPSSFGYTVGQSGTYYLIVSGGLGQDSNGNPTPVPYTLQASATPSPCGYSFTTVSCSVNSPANLSGALQTDNQDDYYAMYVHPNTELSVTVTDTESPSCNGCGYVDAGLYDASGNQVYGASTGASEPNNGITVPQDFSYTVGSGGIYFLVVEGGLGQDANGNPTAVPYKLQVSASPNVTWPPPSATPPPKPKPKPRAPKLVLGAVHHSGHTVRLSVVLAAGAGKLSATATSGRRHRTVRVIGDGHTYKLSVRLLAGYWTIHIRFAGSAGWLTGNLAVRVHIR